jgi:hypothetical protein
MRTAETLRWWPVPWTWKPKKRIQKSLDIPWRNMFSLFWSQGSTFTHLLRKVPNKSKRKFPWYAPSHAPKQCRIAYPIIFFRRNYGIVTFLISNGPWMIN